MVSGASVFVDRSPVVGGHQGQDLVVPEAPLAVPIPGLDPVRAEQQAGGLAGGIPISSLAQAIFDLLEGASGSRSLERIAVDHLGGELNLAVQQRHLGGLGPLAGGQGQQGRIQAPELLDVGLGFAVGFDALDRIDQGRHVRDQREGHHQRHRGDRIEVALQPEGAQR